MVVGREKGQDCAGGMKKRKMVVWNKDLVDGITISDELNEEAKTQR